MGLLKDSPACTTEHFLQVEVERRLSSGSESLGEFTYDSDVSRDCAADGGLPVCEELPSRDQAGYYDDDDFLGMADILPDIPPQTVTEEKYTDEHGNMVVKKVRNQRHQNIQTLTISKPFALGATTTSEFEVEPVQGRKVSKVVKTTVARGERMEKQRGDPSLAADLPSAQEDFEKVKAFQLLNVPDVSFSIILPKQALGYAGGFGKVLLPHVVEKEIVQEDGSVVKRSGCSERTSSEPLIHSNPMGSQMHKSRTQKRTVVRDAQGKHVHLERLDDTPDALQPDALQQHLHHLLQRYCEDNLEEEEQEQERKD
ncbi:hypothetical protein XENOCAPTIV_001972 [Xenoophorus captivus]|uniref:Uncharacterized protein n=1 Tax=Xenoophorus captivus TaxID=1517983 RepID=A0ABV0R4A7_9TELE